MNDKQAQKAFAKQLAKLKREDGLTYRQMEACTGIAQQQLHGYASGKYAPSLATLVRIADRLDVSVDWLLGRWEGE